QQRTFENVAAWHLAGAILTQREGSEDVATAHATASLAPLLGLRLSRGRWFLPGDDGANAAPIVVLSNESWQTRFGSDSSILGRRVTLEGKSHEIVGVLPPGFRVLPSGFPLGRSVRVPEFWLPAGTLTWDLEPRNRNWYVMGLLKPGITSAVAAASSIAT